LQVVVQADVDKSAFVTHPVEVSDDTPHDLPIIVEETPATPEENKKCIIFLVILFQK